jgi:hypothetical protein
MLDIRQYSASERVLLLLCTLLLIHASMTLVISGNHPLSEMFEFRQTQTALSVFWMVKEGLKVFYQTPVVGSPWEIPFEFPTYAWLVAVVNILGVPLNLAGRLVSFVFFIACLLPLMSLGRNLRLGRWWTLAASALFLASPLYLMWGRSFMIETMALFFAVAHLSCFVAGVTQNRVAYLLWSGICGIVAVLTKSTTLPAFSLLAAIFFLVHFIAQRKSSGPLSLSMFVASGLTLIVAYPPGLYWVSMSDGVKTLNIVGQHLTSAALTGWNYGTLDAKLSAELWLKVLPSRILSEIIGPLAVLAILLLLLLQTFKKIRIRFSIRQAGILSLMVIGFLTPIIIFTNLHLVHNYYQVANGIFVIAAVALLIEGLRARFGDVAASVILFGVLSNQLAMFYGAYFPQIYGPPELEDYDLALQARDLTPEGSALLVFGIDWSSTVAYASERKAMSVPNWLPLDQLDGILADPTAWAGGLDIGGIVYCRYLAPGPLKDRFEAFVSGRAQIAVLGRCTLYGPV